MMVVRSSARVWPQEPSGPCTAPAAFGFPGLEGQQLEVIGTFPVDTPNIYSF